MDLLHISNPGSGTQGTGIQSFIDTQLGGVSCFNPRMHNC